MPNDHQPSSQKLSGIGLAWERRGLGLGKDRANSEPPAQRFEIVFDLDNDQWFCFDHHTGEYRECLNRKDAELEVAICNCDYLIRQRNIRRGQLRMFK